ncbi:MAG: hypothetical protein GY810_03700 [Aureispira sp.]|nr:hypothetical protein [Aureispira sp.]
MKSVFNSILFLALSIFLVACSEDAATNDAEIKEEVSSSNDGYISIEELNLNFEKYEGKQVKIKAFSYGALKVNGTRQMQFGTKPQSKNDSYDIAVIVFENENDPLLNIKEDEEIALEGKVGEDEYGAPRLINPKKL